MTLPILLHPSVYHYSFAPHPPVAHVDDGQSVRFVCPDADNTFADGSVVPPHQRDLGLPPTPVEGNPMVGPVALRDLAAGETLAIDVCRIAVTGSTGQTLLAPNHGYLSAADLQDAPPRVMHRWRIDAGAGSATLINGSGSDRLSVRLSPMVGCLGVSPPPPQSISTIHASSHGGNWDLNIVRAGCTVLLPAFVEGGLFMLGDLHAAQGQGEIIGGGIEVAGEVDVRMRRVTDLKLGNPAVLADGILYAVATRDTVDAAIRGAFAALLDLLVDGFQLDRWAGYDLISQSARVVLGGLGISYTVAAGVEESDLPERCFQRLAFLRGESARATE